MTTILNDLFLILSPQIEYILGNLLILASLIIEELILALLTPSGLIASISLAIFFESLIFKSIVEDIKATNLKQNPLAIPKNTEVKLNITNELATL
jgi:hypothetical protein